MNVPPGTSPRGLCALGNEPSFEDYVAARRVLIYERRAIRARLVE